MNASFLIKAKRAGVVTEKGVRTFVMERLLNSSFSKGSAANLDDKTVQVRVAGDKKDIMKFRQQLEKDVAAAFGNPAVTFTGVQETANHIPNLMKSSQALMVGQLQKGVDIQLEILDSLNGLNQGLKGELKDMNRELKEELKAIPRELKGELRALPQELAKAISRHA